jgi:protein-tyrosine phosphatase
MESNMLRALLSDPRRLIALPGARNVRDLGGYPAEGGMMVRWRTVYRSGSLGDLTDAGIKGLGALQLHGVCDLRTTREREAQPYHWQEALNLAGWSRDYESSFAELRVLLAQPFTSADAAKEAMLTGYRRLPFEQAPAYSELFRRLAYGELPVLFNCSAGKDRAGTAAALVLMALGVPRDVVQADYALTDQVARLHDTMAAPRNPDSLLGRQSPDVVRAILGCDPEYMNAALEAAAPTPAAFASYLCETLGVTDDMIQAIRLALLTPHD